MSAPRAVFVCGRNSVRSPMAEALWRARFGEAARVQSCGIEPASCADGFMIAVMREEGADLSGFEPQGLEDVSAGPDTLVVCLAPEADEAARELAQRAKARVEHWHLADPAEIEGSREARLDAYRAIREALKSRINAVVL
ncbi:low molecular weight phosphatase family protein [Glycocaulis abyssi]|uniref:Low molecular weight phosphatase family protein n=1 Tax=Glycocaulis abyssi TaxID=1433403 RepID=A0ABV9NCU9_9PROT